MKPNERSTDQRHLLLCLYQPLIPRPWAPFSEDHIQIESPNIANERNRERIVKNHEIESPTEEEGNIWYLELSLFQKKEVGYGGPINPYRERERQRVHTLRERYFPFPPPIASIFSGRYVA